MATRLTIRAARPFQAAHPRSAGNIALATTLKSPARPARRYPDVRCFSPETCSSILTSLALAGETPDLAARPPLSTWRSPHPITRWNCDGAQHDSSRRKFLTHGSFSLGAAASATLFLSSACSQLWTFRARRAAAQVRMDTGAVRAAGRVAMTPGIWWCQTDCLTSTASTRPSARTPPRPLDNLLLARRATGMTGQLVWSAPGMPGLQSLLFRPAAVPVLQRGHPGRSRLTSPQLLANGRIPAPLLGSLSTPGSSWQRQTGISDARVTEGWARARGGSAAGPESGQRHLHEHLPASNNVSKVVPTCRSTVQADDDGATGQCLR